MGFGFSFFVERRRGMELFSKGGFVAPPLESQKYLGSVYDKNFGEGVFLF